MSCSLIEHYFIISPWHGKKTSFFPSQKFNPHCWMWTAHTKQQTGGKEYWKSEKTDPICMACVIKIVSFTQNCGFFSKSYLTILEIYVILMYFIWGLSVTWTFSPFPLFNLSNLIPYYHIFGSFPLPKRLTMWTYQGYCTIFFTIKEKRATYIGSWQLNSRRKFNTILPWFILTFDLILSINLQAFDRLILIIYSPKKKISL